MRFLAALFIAATAAEGSSLRARADVYNYSVTALREASHLDADGNQPNVSSSTFVMNHLAKCGGTTAKHAVLAAFRHHIPNLVIRPEREELRHKDVHQGGFTFGLIRNPLDYYVSLWAYTASRPDGPFFRRSLPRRIWPELYPELREGHPYGELKEEVKAFYRWLRAVNVDDLGLLSLRFYAHYLDQNALPEFRDGAFNEGSVSHLLGGDQDKIGKWPFQAKGWNNTLALEIRHKIYHFDATSSTVKCWAHTENLIPEMESCLHQYEDKHMKKRFLDWDAFRKATELQTHNPSEHLPCEVFFGNDPAGRRAARLVERADRPLMKLFGYTPTCYSGAKFDQDALKTGIATPPGAREPDDLWPSAFEMDD